jgi:protein O-mannosyl-transferase
VVRGDAVRRLPDFQTPAAAAFLVAAVALALYAPSLANGFAYDDVPLILGDPRVRDLSRIGDIFAGTYVGYEAAIYRPLTTLTLALDWAAAGPQPWWFHLMNVLLHGVASVLVLLLLRSLFPPLAALVGALLFAVHPVHVEAVANVAGRGELLAGTFFLAACVLWLRSGPPPLPPARVAAVAGLFLLALLSKESAVVLPGALVLLDAARGEWRLERAALLAYVRRRGPALAAIAGVLAGYLLLRGAVVGGLEATVLHPAAEVLDRPVDRLRTALLAWPEYARLLLFPRVLLNDYGPAILLPARAWTAGALGGLLLLTALLGTGLLALLRGRGRLALGALWFPLTILPVSNLLLTIGVLVAERTLYVPSVALSLFAAGGIAALPATRPARRAALAAAAVVIALLAGRSLVRVPEWDSTERIFQALERDRPDAYRAQWVMGRAARQQGRLDDATARFDRAIGLWPHRRLLVLEAASLAVERNDLGRARTLAELAARQWPQDLASQRLLAGIALDLGDAEAARAAVHAGLRADPRDPILLQMRDHLAAGERGGAPHDP